MTDNPIDLREQIHAAEENLSHLLDWVNRFDQKSSIIMGIETAMLGLLTGFAPSLSLWTQIMSIFVGLTVALLIFSLAIVALGASPQIKGPDSLLYFGSIAKRSVEEYRRSFRKQTPEAYLEDLLDQCHRNSEIISKKFHRIRWAYGALALAFTPWVITLLLFRSTS